MRKLKNEELNRPTIDEYKSIDKQPLIVILDNVRSLNNVGSAFRTSDAFSIEKVILCGITGKPPHREIQKTALGATESVEWEYFDNTIDAVHKLKSEGWTILAVEQTEKSILLDDFIPSSEEKYCLIFGNEVYGVDQGVIAESHNCLEIPQFGTKHSLNIAVSLGVVIWHMTYLRRK